MFQSTRPRGARRDHPSLDEISENVSIHAPAWGATLNQQPQAGRAAGFNPRARVGRDPPLPRGSVAASHVSIHAPAWGATRTQFVVSPSLNCFNPRARVGRDRTYDGMSMVIHGFNPRARVGRDLIIVGEPGVEPVSIHAPAWGATTPTLQALNRKSSFNPRARVGRDSYTSKALPLTASFNPRARVGRDTAG